MVTSLKKLYAKVRHSFCLNIRKCSFVEVSFNNQMNEHKVLLKMILQFIKIPLQCVYPNGQWYFCRKIQNFTVVLKRPFVFYSEMQNFGNCIQTAIRFFTTKQKILNTATNWLFMFLQRKNLVINLV